MPNRKLGFLIAAVLTAAMLWGCGSSGSGGSEVSVGGPPAPGDIDAVGIQNCATCHGGSPATTQWLQSRHANSNLTRAHEGNPTCTPCHNPLGDGSLMSQALGVTNRDVVGCESCHGGGSAHRGIGEIPYPKPNVARCTGCHGLDSIKFHDTRANRQIVDTHFDKADTADIEGYVVDIKDDRGCLACHFNPHELNVEINEQWAHSAHGGHIAKVKEAAEAAALAEGKSSADAVAASIAAVLTENEAPAWVYYDFKGSDRASCQRCHTSTGAAAYLTDPAAYGAGKNTFFATGAQREMIYCWACHVADGSPALRTPGPITADYTGAATTYPDAAASNICLSCHIGRESGDSIQASTGDFTNIGFINSHYLAAGGNLYGLIGYEYVGRDYAADPIFAHPRLGTEGNLGENGPCVSCHMSATKSHHFMPVTLGAGDLVASVNSPICASCHAGINANWLNDAKEECEGAITALEKVLGSKGIFFAASYPYFFKDADGNGQLDASEIDRNNGVRNWGNKETMGAAFNYNMLHHDPGTYAHNPEYAKRLIWDSIDWLDDTTLNHSTAATVAALAENPIKPFKAPAAAYLGATRP